MTFEEFLSYLLTVNGLNAALGFLLSFIVEWWPAFEELEAKWKRLVFLGLNLVIALGSAVLMATMGYAPWDFEALFWPAIMAAFTAFVSGNLAHIRQL